MRLFLSFIILMAQIFSCLLLAKEKSVSSSRANLYSLVTDQSGVFCFRAINKLHCDFKNQLENDFLNKTAAIKDLSNAKKLDDNLKESTPADGKYFDVYKSRNSKIYLYHFKSKIGQDLMFERMGQFIQSDKPGNLGAYTYTLQADGHDLEVSDIAKFFNMASSKKIPLNALEIRLKDSLLQSGLVVQAANGFYSSTSEAAILAVSSESSEGTIKHEINHGLFFTNSNYRKDIEMLWNSLDGDTKKYVSKVIKNVFDGLTIEKNRNIFLTEFAATFADVPVLKRDYLNRFNLIDPDKLDRIELALNRIKLQYSTNRPQSKILTPNSVR